MDYKEAGLKWEDLLWQARRLVTRKMMFQWFTWRIAQKERHFSTAYSTWRLISSEMIFQWPIWRIAQKERHFSTAYSTWRLKWDDLSMAYLKDCTKRDIFFNDLQYLEAEVRWSFNGLFEGLHKKRDIFQRFTVPCGWSRSSEMADSREMDFCKT